MPIRRCCWCCRAVGSSEIARHLDLFGETVQLLETRCGPLELVLPTVPAVRAKVEQGTARWAVAPSIVVEPADKWRAFRTARAALAVSGTVTLELALAGVPSVVIYRVSLFEEAIGRMFLRGSTIVLANLVLGENAMPEFLQRDATPERLAAAVAPLLGPTPRSACARSTPSPGSIASWRSARSHRARAPPRSCCGPWGRGDATPRSALGIWHLLETKNAAEDSHETLHRPHSHHPCRQPAAAKAADRSHPGEVSAARRSMRRRSRPRAPRRSRRWSPSRSSAASTSSATAR